MYSLQEMNVQIPTRAEIDVSSGLLIWFCFRCQNDSRTLDLCGLGGPDEHLTVCGANLIHHASPSAART